MKHITLNAGNDTAGGVNIQSVIAKIFKNRILDNKFSPKPGNMYAIGIGSIDALGSCRKANCKPLKGKIPASGINGAALTGGGLYRDVLQQYIGAIAEGHLIGWI